MTSGSMILTRDFYRQADVVTVSRQLLGKVLCTQRGGTLTSAMITETEAYSGRNDKACHANGGLRTARTEIMYGPPGHAYVYLCYGIHHLFNVVTNNEGLADAVLIRAVKPLDGAEAMLERRGRNRLEPSVANGPGKLTHSLGITTEDNGTNLLGDRIWIENRGIPVPDTAIGVSSRIGVDYAGEDAKRRWRFFIADSNWLSR